MVMPEFFVLWCDCELGFVAGVDGPLAPDGRLVVTDPKMIPLIGDVSDVVIADAVHQVFFKAYQDEIPKSELILRGGFIVSAKFYDILKAARLGSEIVMRPAEIEIVGARKKLLGYSWIDTRVWVPEESRFPDVDFFGWSPKVGLRWVVRRALAQQIASAKLKGVQLIPLGGGEL